jgi:nucleoside-diphosphate-sugar epimerase
MIVAITGGTGFIGTRLALHLLSRGDSVRLLSRSLNAKKELPDGITFHQGDLIDDSADLYSFVKGADVLFHCAGEIIDPIRMHALHVAGTQRLITAASQSIGHWVQLSSTGAYGRVTKGVVIEESPLNPNNQYEITKTESDRLVTAAADRGLFTSTILRPSNVFGPTMPNQSLFQLVSMISRGLFFFVGDVGASANYIYVDNVVDGLVRCATMEEAKGNTFILSDNRLLEDFVAVIAEALGKQVPRLRFPEMPVRLAVKCFEKLPGFPLTTSRLDALTNRAVYSTRHIQQSLNYTHPVQMEDGLQQLILAWKHNQ